MLTQANYTLVVNAGAQTSDEGLILACRQGDENAWNVLVNRFQRLIYTIPRRAGLDEDHAAEVFQSTFAKLLENLDRIRQPECIQAWLVTTARRETLQLIRRQSTEQSVIYTDDPEGTHTPETIPDDRPLPSEELERLEEQHIVRMAIQNMDARCRCLLELLYYRSDPASYSDIAAALDMPEGSLGPTRARCLEKLRRLLAGMVF
jgi:RNA polymerase sigma factor (sigma-70 family)